MNVALEGAFVSFVSKRVQAVLKAGEFSTAARFDTDGVRRGGLAG